MEYKIYSLSNPENNEIFYIGITRFSLIERRSTHFAEVKYSMVNEKKSEIIKALNFNVDITLIELVNDTQTVAYQKEKYYIKKYLADGHPLCNLIHTHRKSNRIIPSALKVTTIRPGKEFAGIIERLELEAKKKRLSLNKYVLISLQNIITQNDEKDARPPIGG